MVKIEFNVNQTRISKVRQNGESTTGNVHQIECKFNFSDEYKNLNCVAVFGDVMAPIVNGVVYADNLKEGTIDLGVYGYSVDEQGKIKVRISPKPCRLQVCKGSYKEVGEGQTPTPSQFEQYVNTINELVEAGKLRGNGITNIQLISSEIIDDRKVDTYQINFTDSEPTTFTVVNGKDGQGGGTGNYDDLTNKPAIDGVELNKDSTAENLGLAKTSDLDTHKYHYEEDEVEFDFTGSEIIGTVYGVAKSLEEIDRKKADKSEIPTIPVTDVQDSNGTSLIDGTIAKLPDIPSKTSDLTNDSGFVTDNDLDTKQYKYQYQGEQVENTVGEIAEQVVLNYDNIEGIQGQVDTLARDKASNEDVERWLEWKQNKLTEQQIDNINDVPNKASKDYVDEQISTVEMAKFPNATIIGTPTINNGQISNFTRNNYLKFPFLVNFQNIPFTINFDITTGANVVSQENILDSDFGLAFAIRNSRFVIAISTNGTSWNLGEGVGTLTVQPNSSYRIAISWNGTQYTVAYSVNGGETYTDDIVIASNQAPYTKQMFIGVGENFEQVVNSFSGIINLNYANLIIADKIVWQGMDDVGIASRLAIDLSNIDSAGEQRINDIIAETKEYIEDSPSKQELVILTLVDNHLYIANGFVNGFKLPTDFTGLCVIKLTTGATAPTIDVTGLICAGEFATTAIGANETWDISIDGNQVIGAKFVERSAS